MRRAPEPRGTLKPLWNIIPDGTITDYTPTTISIDTHNRANARIRKSNLAIATETYQKPTPPPQSQEPKPRLMHFVACKTVREYNRNREKIRKFCLEEKKEVQREAQMTGTQHVLEQKKPAPQREHLKHAKKDQTRTGQENVTWKATSHYSIKQDHPARNPTGTPKNYELNEKERHSRHP